MRHTRVVEYNGLYQVAEPPGSLFLDLNVRKVDGRIVLSHMQKNQNPVTRQTLVC